MKGLVLKAMQEAAKPVGTSKNNLSFQLFVTLCLI